MSQDNNQVRIVFTKEEWSFIYGAVSTAQGEGWPYRENSREEYLKNLETYDEIARITEECLGKDEWRFPHLL